MYQKWICFGFWLRKDNVSSGSSYHCECSPVENNEIQKVDVLVLGEKVELRYIISQVTILFMF
jgi:hypothetical protein